MELHTERLILRPVEAAGLDDLVEVHEDPLVLRFFGSYGREDLARGRGLATEAARAASTGGSATSTSIT